MYTNQDKQAYWGQAARDAEKARTHTKAMEEQYADEIEHSRDRSVLYLSTPLAPTWAGTTHISVVPTDSVSAIFSCGEEAGKVAVLNFASYKEPGGRFMDGSMAQEEALCHASFLYNVLSWFDGTYYDWNRAHKNRSLYMSRGIFSEDVRFFLGDETRLCNVITCACPNWTAAHKYCAVSHAENLLALRHRCEFVLSVAAKNSVDTLILGAYGCGVFGQDPAEVAESFMLALQKYEFKHVIFAIPNTGAGARNYQPFARMFA